MTRCACPCGCFCRTSEITCRWCSIAGVHRIGKMATLRKVA